MPVQIVIRHGFTPFLSVARRLNYQQLSQLSFVQLPTGESDSEIGRRIGNHGVEIRSLTFSHSTQKRIVVAAGLVKGHDCGGEVISRLDMLAK